MRVKWACMARCSFPTSLFFSLGLLVLVCVPRSVMAEWSAIAESKVSYTDDVTNFSAARRLKFSEDPSQPSGLPRQLSDIIWDPSLQVIRSSSSPLGPNALGFIFTNNPSFNYGDYLVQFRQGLSPDTSLLIRYRNVPNMFLGPNIERRTGNNLIEGERVTSHTLRMDLEHRLSESWKLTLIGRAGLRIYNDAFAERDTKRWTLGSQVGYAVNSHVSLTMAYL